MAKHLNDIFCYERGQKLIAAFQNKNTEQAKSMAQQIAVDLSEFVSASKWNNILLEVDTSSAKLIGEVSLPVLEIGIRPKEKIKNVMELIDAISDVEDIIDAAIHDIEDFNGIYISLNSIA